MHLVLLREAEAAAEVAARLPQQEVGAEVVVVERRRPQEGEVVGVEEGVRDPFPYSCAAAGVDRRRRRR